MIDKFIKWKYLVKHKNDVYQAAMKCVQWSVTDATNTLFGNISFAIYKNVSEY